MSEYYLEHKASGVRAGPFPTDIEAWAWYTRQPLNSPEYEWHCLNVTTFDEVTEWGLNEKDSGVRGQNIR